jgi:hypothetical protein
MSFVRKHFLLIAFTVLAAFATVLTAECVHHHSVASDSDQCAFCSFLRSGSQASSTPVAPAIVPVLLFFVLFFTKIFFDSFNSISPCGRSPPNILL